MASVSDTKLFVGRLPADARIEEVEDVFGAFGKIVRLGQILLIERIVHFNLH